MSASESREDWLRRFEEALVRLFGPRGFPLSAVGDLDDLLCCLEQTVGLLRDLAASGSEEDAEKLRSTFVRLGVVLEQDLPMILDDLRPAMQGLLAGDTPGAPSQA